jgi:hypothetical protein
VIKTVTGTLVKDGCAFDVSGSGPARNAQTEDVEIGEDTATCTATFEVGTPTDIAAATALPAGSHVSSTSASTGSAKPSSPSSYQDNKWLDPLGIQVNAQEQWLTWTESRCHVSAKASWKWFWFDDGWLKLNGSGKLGTTCTQATSDAGAGFDNAVFCDVITGQPGIPTFTEFGYKKADVLTGTYTGGWAWSYDDDKSGGCSGLLHHGHVFTYHA